MKHKPLTYREIDSTNAEAARLLRSGNLPGGVVILTDYQSSGRGQEKNVWVSDPGKNILMSWIVYPAFLSVQDQFQLSKAVSLAITDFLGAHSLDARIKWPNDILCSDAKICGILIENGIMGGQIRHSIVGIGLNVRQERFPEFPWKATSMFLEAGTDVAPGGLAASLAGFLDLRYDQLAGGGAEVINRAYLQRLYRLDVPSIFTDGRSQFTGVVRGVDDSGRLRVEAGAGITSYGFHEIRMLCRSGS
ncbi:MAG: biotin--[acetyl-CoA-carboxylase] ligase [Bacteroidales bacterium]|nr:biotin--[acetyl-CoA-carboxylase] ligase [Bacteroidales bacterium]MDT8431074.1 biotin--[acetyl-CoA-carboxylase] ligase [Bacteroidales bacterium]